MYCDCKSPIDYDINIILDQHAKTKKKRILYCKFFFTFRLYDDGVRKGSVVIQGLEEVRVHDKQEVYRILERGSERRRTAETKMNANSSRSHTVIRNVRQCHR